MRKSKDGKKKLLFVLNMTPIMREDFEVGVPAKKKCKLVLNSDEVRFGGNGNEIPLSITPTAEECDNLPYRIKINLAPFSAAVFEI